MRSGKRRGSLHSKLSEIPVFVDVKMLLTTVDEITTMLFPAGTPDIPVLADIDSPRPAQRLREMRPVSERRGAHARSEYRANTRAL